MTSHILDKDRSSLRISGEDIKTEAWVLRNLITVLCSAARRPHTPRSPEMRALFRAIGIDAPEPRAQPVKDGDGTLVATSCM